MAFLYSIFDIFGFLSEMHFVLQVIVFAYILYWLYINFRENQILFGLSSIIAAYFVILNPITTTTLVVLFVAFAVMGMHLQMLIQFGVYPLFRFFGMELEHPEMAEQQQMQAIEKKLMEGKELSHDEVKFLEKSQQRQMEYQKHVQQYMRPSA